MLPIALEGLWTGTRACISGDKGVRTFGYAES
jgi:hypothetical protein